MRAADPAWPVVSVATISTEAEPAAVGVPVMVPVDELMDRPAGRPVAVQVMVTPLSVSVALLATGVMAEPVTEVWLAGLATMIDEVIVKVNEVDPAKKAPSVAVPVTTNEPPVVGVPERVPVDELIAKPVGRLVADQVRV